ncbi:unnamed protein product [Owenia fusiformis]|uniref:Uncharacterized protein n=1 Tax=Owenia fusiformis TaxID=6347 RepID=A0A8J1XXB2_OWEFU|nr:unnamed protein product [Owenia fusiformis]
MASRPKSAIPNRSRSRSSSREGSKSRAGSKGKDKKGKKKKEKPLTPKQMKKLIAEQVKELEELRVSVANLTTENTDLKEKLELIIRKLVNNIDVEQFEIEKTTPTTEIKMDTIIDMMTKLITRFNYRGRMETRIEELESKLTHQNNQVARLVQRNLAIENGLCEMSLCYDFDELHRRISHLQLETSEALTPLGDAIYHPSSPRRPTGHLVNTAIEGRTPQVQEDLETFLLTPPSRRLPGDTHITNIYRELKLYLMKELSLEKSSGADWRMLAQRVMIPDDTINYWVSLQMEFPMGRVFAEWGESEDATVRILHRHLQSPQMRLVLLAKRISDFYDVD